MIHWIKTFDGSSTLLNPDINEMYHSKHGAWSECRHVFVDPFLEHAAKHPRETWRILDLGFGLGLNWLCVVDQIIGRKPTYAKASAGRHGFAPTIEIISIERDPAILNIQVSREQLGQFPISDEALELLQHYKTYRKVDHSLVKAELLVGDACSVIARPECQRGGACLPAGRWQSTENKFDIIFHDAFSPKKNPECWSDSFFQSLACCCHDGTLLMTYSVAGSVKKALTNSGFEIKKRPGFGGKRECLVAVCQGHKRLEK